MKVKDLKSDNLHEYIRFKQKGKSFIVQVIDYRKGWLVADGSRTIFTIDPQTKIEVVEKVIMWRKKKEK